MFFKLKQGVLVLGIGIYHNSLYILKSNVMINSSKIIMVVIIIQYMGSVNSFKDRHYSTESALRIQSVECTQMCPWLRAVIAATCNWDPGV